MKKLKGLISLFLISVSLFGLTACGDDRKTSAYEQITAEQAKILMDTEEDYVIIDARTAEEFDESHIEGAVLLSYEDVKSKAHIVLPDKKQLILIYCRSGRRSKIAAQALADLGYVNVKEFGGIIDWPYDTVK